jgi:hypothetical protein
VISAPIACVASDLDYGPINLDMIKFPFNNKWLGNYVYRIRTNLRVGALSVPFYLTQHTPGTDNIIREPLVLLDPNPQSTHSFNIQ